MTTRNEMTARSQLLSACCASPDNAEHHELSPEQISLFKVPLGCRVTAKVTLSDGTIETLLAVCAQVCRHQLIDRPLTSARLRRKLIANEFLKVGRQHLHGVALKALQEAVALGHRPVRGEQ